MVLQVAIQAIPKPTFSGAFYNGTNYGSVDGKPFLGLYEVATFSLRYRRDKVHVMSPPVGWNSV